MSNHGHSGTSRPSQCPGVSSRASILQPAALAAISLALLRSGIYNALLVLACSALLLCNPWIRTLLELPPADGSAKARSIFDPTRYLAFQDPQDGHGLENQDTNIEGGLGGFYGQQTKDSLGSRREEPLAVMPGHLRAPTERILKLILRDFVIYWYDPIAFSHADFPAAANSCIEKFVSSVYLRASTVRNVDATAELMLTTSSVLITSLRRRREQKSNATDALPEVGERLEGLGIGPGVQSSRQKSWNTTSARVSSLRSAVTELLVKNLPSCEKQSQVLVLLMTEILTKQLWEVVQKISNPDFINQQIIEWSKPADETHLAEQTIGKGEALVMAGEGGDEAADLGPVRSQSLKTEGDVPAKMPASRHSNNIDTLGGLPALDVVGGSTDRTHSSSNLWDPAKPSQSLSTSATLTSTIGTLGSFASSAFGTISDVAEKTVDVVGGTVDNIGTALLGGDLAREPEMLPPRLPPRHPEVVGVSNSRRGDEAQRDFAPTSTRPSSYDTRTMHFDMPPSQAEMPLPESLANNLRSKTSADPDSTVQGYSISEGSSVTVAQEISLEETSWSSSKENHAYPSLSEVLSRQDSVTYDAFESFLENSLRLSADIGEGETLLRLHTQLGTLSTIAAMMEPDEKTFRADASTILSKALPGLPVRGESDGAFDVRASVERTLAKLESKADVETMKPLEHDVVTRLGQLYELFCLDSTLSTSEEKETLPVPNQLNRGAPLSEIQPYPTGAKSSSSAPQEETKQLGYEPRRKATGSTISRPPSVPPRPTSIPPRPASLSLKDQSASHQAVASSMSDDACEERDTVIASAALPLQTIGSGFAHPDPILKEMPGNLEVTVTDVSPNAGRAAPLDPKSLEVMVAVEGFSISALGSGGGGFILLRRWSEFEALNQELARAPRSAFSPPKLPSPKGKDSASFCSEIEIYLKALLSPRSNHDFASSAPVINFVDKTRAGAPADRNNSRSGASTILNGIGKSFANSVEAVGKTARNSFVLQNSGSMTSSNLAQGTTAFSSSGVNAITGGSGLPGPSRSASKNSSTQTSNLAAVGAATGTSSPWVESESSFENSRRPTPSPSPPPPPSMDLSNKDLDKLLSAVFAVADEAFNLQGSWTLRRGMLRVLEQIIRSTYSSSLISTFNNSASGLNSKNFGKWIDATRESFWPGGEWSTEVGTERTKEEREETERKAREIIISYAPSQAGYMLGPGGRMACVNALKAVHESLTDPLTASDLGLNIVLRLIDMACR
ncbi:hypothetical protein IE53DRAFT_370113 [Violaceomyces palustris]|uniref:Uncharacterized protein n=1 Tax=Violaceomyces palustris TaxID=1673888 RepID=A0ACD0NT62_9BASI|nr:hypothetical protein IE53DRAFT_370113 [Violaceomyces palustris]